jgi:DNA-binding MarR family transcriptional regulator
VYRRYRNRFSAIVVRVDERRWTFLSNHGHVLVCLASDPELRLRDLAERVGITERSAQQIVRDLEQAGYVVKERVGRRNRYTVVRSGRLRHRLEHQVRVGELIDLVMAHDDSPQPA